MYNFKVTYFKPSGKFYTSEMLPKKYESLYDAMQVVQELALKQRLPGLVEDTKWEGPILVTLLEKDGSHGLPGLVDPNSLANPREVARQKIMSATGLTHDQLQDLFSS